MVSDAGSSGIVSAYDDRGLFFRALEVSPIVGSDAPLTVGKLNAIRAAFKAGVTPSRIAREFGLSQSDVRKAFGGG